MTVARSAALAAAARSAMTWSSTWAPASVSEFSDASRARLDPPDVLERRDPVPEPLDDLLEGSRLDEAGPRARVGQDPLGLLGRGRLVDRHDGRARGPDRVVDQRPLIPGVRHQRDPVPGLDARRDQALGQRGDLVPELAGGHVGPLPGQASGSRPAQHHRLRLLGRPAEDDLGEIRGGGDLRQGRNAVLAHGASIQVDTRQHKLKPLAGRFRRASTRWSPGIRRALPW